MSNVLAIVRNNTTPQQAQNISLKQVKDQALVISSQEPAQISAQEALLGGLLNQMYANLIEDINNKQPLAKMQQAIEQQSNGNQKEIQDKAKSQQQAGDQSTQEQHLPVNAMLNSKPQKETVNAPVVNGSMQQETPEKASELKGQDSKASLQQLQSPDNKKKGDSSNQMLGKTLDDIEEIKQHANQIRTFLMDNNGVDELDKISIAHYDALAKEQMEDIRAARQKVQDLVDKKLNPKVGDLEVDPKEIAVALKEAEDKLLVGLKSVEKAPEQINQIRGQLKGSGYGVFGDSDSGGDYNPNIFGSDLTSIQQMFNAGVSFFALLISALIFGYDVASEAGKLQMLKQAIAQDASKYATDLNKFLSELNELIGQKNGTDSEKNLYDFLNSDDGKALMNKYSNFFKAAGFDVGSLKWNDSDKDHQALSNILNGTIEYVNSKLRSVNASDASIVSPFKTGDNGDIDMDDILTSLTNQKSSCETATAELTTMNNKLTAAVNQATETVKSLLDWLKQTIANYGSSVSQR